MTFVPKLLLFIVILIIGVIVARLLAKAVNAILERVGFDRAIERGGIGRVMEKSKYDPSDILAKIVYYAVLLFTLQLAFSAFGPNPISELLTAIIAFLPRVFVAIVIVVVAAAIAAAVKSLIQGTLGGLSYGRTLANIAAVFILGLGIIAALNQVGIATTVTTPVLIAVLATIAGILIVGVGGGLVRPMQSRWESYLTKAEAEAPRIRQEAAMAPSATEQMRDTKDQLESQYGSGSTTYSEQPTAVYDQTMGATAYDPNQPSTAYDPTPYRVRQHRALDGRRPQRAVDRVRPQPAATGIRPQPAVLTGHRPRVCRGPRTSRAATEASGRSRACVSTGVSTGQGSATETMGARQGGRGMQIDKQEILELLRSRGEHDTADQAENELPDEVDTDEHAAR